MTLLAQVAIVWSASCGSITPASSTTADFTYPAAGTCQITATAGGKSFSVPVAVAGAGTIWRPGCLPAEPTITVSGSRTTKYDTRPNPLAAGGAIDARGLSMVTAMKYPVYFDQLGGGCWIGARIMGTFNPDDPWTDWHYRQAVYVGGPRPTIEGARIDNTGDGVTFTVNTVTDLRLSHSWISRAHDDCVENDFLQNAVIEDNLLADCYMAFSLRPALADRDTIHGEQHTAYLRRNLVSLGIQQGVYSGPSPGAATFFKLAALVSRRIRLVIEDNIFFMRVTPGLGDGCLQPGVRNVIVWTGAGSYPCLPLPPGWTLTTDSTVWLTAVAAWRARHPGMGP